MKAEKEPTQAKDTPFLRSLRARDEHQLEPLLTHYANHPETVELVQAEIKARRELTTIKNEA